MNTPFFSHQYIERSTERVVTEELIGDRSVSFLYNSLRENAPAMFRMLTSGRVSSLLSYFQYDLSKMRQDRATELFDRIGADWHECVDPISFFNTHRKVFERQIRYWETRPMEDKADTVVSPADSRILLGSLSELSALFIKDKFFKIAELLGAERPWHNRFADGDFAVFRLTPDKYHYNHVPVSGRVLDFYQLDGCYHSCNPTAQIAVVSVYSKNKRVVTVIDTDTEGGSGVGIVVMVEIVALMIGDIIQAYSLEKYASPQPISLGMFLNRGCPKSLYRPGSSTDVLLFEPGRITFAPDLINNSRRNDVQSRFTNSFGRSLVETDIQVRSSIAGPVQTQLSGVASVRHPSMNRGNNLSDLLS